MTSQVQLQQSGLDMTAQVDNYQTAPEYSYDLRFNQWNLAECEGLEELPTSINAHLQGQGKYTTPERLQLSSKIRIDSSMVNREFIEELHAEIVVKDTVVQVNGGRLRSAIADGNFESRMHLLRWYDIDNRLNMDVEIKDIQTFAGLAGVETLQTTGALTGQISPANEDELQFTGHVDFENLQYGDMVSSEAIEGNVDILLREQPQYTLELNLSNPVVNSVVLQDVSTSVRGKMTPDSTYGDIQLMFSSASGNRLQHEATYSVSSEISRVRTTDLQIISDLRTLSLAQPFEAVVKGQQFRMDTLRLESNDGAAMEMAIPYADSVSQRGYLLGKELNLSVIQNTLLSESHFDGMLSGRLYIDKRDTLLSASGNLKLEQIAYNDVSLDSLDLDFEVDDERLEGGLLLFDKGERLASGQLQVPFKLGDPNTFDQSFFKEKVSGRLIVRELSVSRYPQLLENAGITNTDGLARFQGTISGTAGEPEMQASFRLRQATISGVGVDSVTATMDYDHTTRQIQLNSSVVSLKQKAAEITAQLPVHLDVKEFNVALPEQKDSIWVDINTYQFNLASLNDFVDRTEFREIQGRLDGSLVIEGPLNQLSAEGMMSFQNGAIRVMEAGVKFSEIRSAVYFRGNRVEIEKMNARSGTGSFSASGSMNFNELQPGALDIAMKANNFRVANTANYSAIIDMDTKLNGTLSKPNIKGKLSFVSGFLYLQNFGEKSVEAVELDSAAAPGYATSYMQYDSLSMEMDVSFNRRFFVRNRQYLDLEYELDGQVDLVKKREQDLQMFGSLSAASGYARPLGKRFELEEGIITFRGEPTNPELKIRHLFIPPQQDLADVRIWYIIEGTVEDPQFKYESEPPMGLEDIISYTLFGKPFLSLDPWKQVVANSGSNTSAADVAMDVLLDKVEALATQRLGIDVVQIDNTRNGANSGTSIKTGWYLNPKVFFAIQNEITGSTPDTIFILEYLLKRNLKLILTQGGDSRTGIDVRWNYDY
ncbi:MAG: translocation/assembly module TamB domain-containing protein [Balneolaceae bacterium]|nr:translocation/assembly module TamB domain-containing protein [Balneolaceae bacterium]